MYPMDLAIDIDDNMLGNRRHMKGTVRSPFIKSENLFKDMTQTGVWAINHRINNCNFLLLKLAKKGWGVPSQAYLCFSQPDGDGCESPS